MKTLLFIFPLFLSNCSGHSFESKEQTPGLEKVSKGTVERVLNIDGYVVSSETKPISIPRVGWTWEYTIEWLADEGSHVHSGDVIMRLDHAEIDKDLQTRRESFATETLKLEQEKSKSVDAIADAQSDILTNDFNLKKAKLMVTTSDIVSAVERQKEVLDVSAMDIVLKRSKERLISTKVSGDQSIKVQALQVESKKKDVKEFEDGLAKLNIKAPQDGVLLFTAYAGQGGTWQKARPGATAHYNTVVAEVANPDKLIIRAYVPEVDAAGLAVGLQALVSLDIDPSATTPAKVIRVSSLSSTVSERDGKKSTNPFENVRQVEIDLAMDSFPPHAMPGMTARVQLNVIRKDDVVRVPLASVSTEATDAAQHTDLDLNSHDFFVHQVDTSKKQHWQKIALGVIGGAYVEVTSGLSPGDVVMVP